MSFFRFALLGIALSLAGLGCSGKLDGTFYLDADGNNNPEAYEQTLANLNLKVTRDGKLVAAAKTNAKGKYFLNINEPGYYCVEVNEPHLSQSVMRQLTYGRIPAEAVQATQSNFSLGPPVGELVAQSAKQLFSPPPVSNPPPPSNPPPTSQTQQPSPPPASSPAQPDRIEPGIVCKNTTDYDLTLDVPVAIDYSTDVERMPPHITQERRTGEIFTVAIPVSIGCTLESIYTPDGLEPLWPVDPNEISRIQNIDRASGRIDFRAVRQSTSVVLHFKVKEDLPLGTYSTKIMPAQLCPGDQRIVLPEQAIELHAEPLLEIFQELPSSEQAEEGQMTWTIFVKNKGSRDYEATVVGTVNRPVASLTPEAGVCRTAGSTRIECSATLRPDETKSFQITVAIPEVNFDEVLTFNASISVDGSDDSLTAESADVSINNIEE